MKGSYFGFLDRDNFLLSWFERQVAAKECKSPPCNEKYYSLPSELLYFEIQGFSGKDVGKGITVLY